MATPYTESGAVDYEDLEREVDFLDRCGVQGMVWPQMASEYTKLIRQERLDGMKAIARAAKGRSPALVLGVQAADTESMLAYVRYAEALEPDAVIAMPPTEAKSLDDYRAYYAALCRATSRPVFIQTTGGVKGIDPSPAFIVELARQFPNFGYVKEENEPLIDRMLELRKHRPAIKALFSGSSGWPYQMRLGFDGMMPGAPYADLYAQIWTLHEAGREDKAREIFAHLLLLTTLEGQIPGMRYYVMQKRGVFKTRVSRRTPFRETPEAIREIDETFDLLKPYWKV
jgi:dihydrodipicolinate synthase/N-acetylneuraminate lyase